MQMVVISIILDLKGYIFQSNSDLHNTAVIFCFLAQQQYRTGGMSLFSQKLKFQILCILLLNRLRMVFFFFFFFQWLCRLRLPHITSIQSLQFVCFCLFFSSENFVLWRDVLPPLVCLYAANDISDCCAPVYTIFATEVLPCSVLLLHLIRLI